MKAIGKLDWTVENALNTIMVDELSNLRMLLLKKQRTEPKPACFAIAPQQPPMPIELDLEL